MNGDIMIGAIVAFVLGLVLLIWTAHIVLHILGWVLVIGAGIWLVRYLLGRQNRTNL
jgi:hypothetical protein